MRRWLVTGAAGQLGAHVLRCLACEIRRGDTIHAVARTASPDAHFTSWADLRSNVELAALLRDVLPTHILHFAGISSPSAAERDPPSARALHVDALMMFADYAASNNAWILTASSDFVWSGQADGVHTEDDRPAPRTIYGHTKLLGERVLLARAAGLVARYSLLYGLPLASRITSWTSLADRLLRNERIDAVTNEWRTPLTLADAAAATVALALKEHRGLLNIAGPEVLTPFQLIAQIRDALGSRSEIRPAFHPNGFGSLARPRNVAQSADLLRRLLPGFVAQSAADAFRCPCAPLVRNAA